LCFVTNVLDCSLFLLHSYFLQPQWSSGSRVGGQACQIDLNVLQALNARLRQQEQQCHHLEVALRQQQQQSEIILKRKLTQTDLSGRRCRGNAVFVVGVLSISAMFVQSYCVHHTLFNIMSMKAFPSYVKFNILPRHTDIAAIQVCEAELTLSQT